MIVGVIGGVILAGGAGRRFGSPKQVADLHGRPLLEHAVLAMDAAGLDRVVVVLGANAETVREAVPMHGAEPVICEDWSEGRGACLRAGLRALSEADAVVITLGDQPLISPRAIARVRAVAQEALTRHPDLPPTAFRATYGGKPAHPVLLTRAALALVAANVRGDAGAASVGGLETVSVDCDGLGSPADVDTPEDLAQLRLGGHDVN
jgi:molybdenum cofactor cytidylyltransferase